MALLYQLYLRYLSTSLYLLRSLAVRSIDLFTPEARLPQVPQLAKQLVGIYGHGQDGDDLVCLEGSV